jgi:hypothetical protein
MAFGVNVLLATCITPVRGIKWQAVGINMVNFHIAKFRVSTF